jgi:hypothetical protein
MTQTHRITLRGHWTIEGDRKVRRFGKPRLTDPRERVWLVVESLGVEGAVELNGIALPIDRTKQRADVTSLLQERNVVGLLRADGVDEVVLEIAL